MSGKPSPRKTHLSLKNEKQTAIRHDMGSGLGKRGHLAWEPLLLNPKEAWIGKEGRGQIIETLTRNKNFILSTIGARVSLPQCFHSCHSINICCIHNISFLTFTNRPPPIKWDSVHVSETHKEWRRQNKTPECGRIMLGSNASTRSKESTLQEQEDRL